MPSYRTFNAFREVLERVFDLSNLALRVNVVADSSTVLTITGSVASPTNITALGGITYLTGYHNQLIYLQGSGGNVTVTANPQISNGNADGDLLELRGCNASQKVTLADGTGLSMNGSFSLGAYDSLVFRWDTQKWVEISRRENA